MHNCCEQSHGICSRSEPPCPAAGGSLYFLWRSPSLTLETQILQFKISLFYAHSLKKAEKSKKSIEGQHTTEMLWCCKTKMNESSLEETERSRQMKGNSHVAVKLPSPCFFFFRKYSRQKYQVIWDQADYWQELQSLSFLSSLSGAESWVVGSPLRTSSLDSEL